MPCASGQSNRKRGMEARGKVTAISRDWMRGRWTLTLDLDDMPGESMDEIASLEEVAVSIGKPRKKRSLNANAYFHVLVSKIAEKLGASNTDVKNRLIREYGFFEYQEDGKIPIWRVKAEYESSILSRELVHFRVIGREYIGGEEYIKAAIMRGSHEYDTKEMARLIDGTVQEARELGIETLPPEELKRMVEGWKGA